MFGRELYIQIQHPLAADEYSDPESDVAIVTGAMRNYRNAHPTWAVLVAEGAHESLQHDGTAKQRLYARCGIADCWIVALPDARLEVYREPGEDGYRSAARHAAGDSVAPLARPDARIGVEELLP